MLSVLIERDERVGAICCNPGMDLIELVRLRQGKLLTRNSSIVIRPSASLWSNFLITSSNSGLILSGKVTLWGLDSFDKVTVTPG